MASLRDRIDKSPEFLEFTKQITTWLSQQRGVPMLVAIGLTLLSLIVHIVLAFVPNSVLLSLIAFILLHVAILVGFVGMVLAEPLGRG